MNNTITASISFDFKGQSYNPSATLDLDQLMEQHGSLPELYSLLATVNQIDSYSYEYEMMVSETVQFSNAQGWVTQFCKETHFDQLAFEQHWHEKQAFNLLAPAIKEQLGIDDIEQHPAIKSVLVSAYQLGKQSK